MIKWLSLLAVAGLSCTFQAFSAEPVLRSGDILAQQQALRADLDAGKPPFDNMPRSRKQSILSDQKKLAKLLEGTTDTAQLGERDRNAVVNLVSRIQANIKDSDEALVCTQEARTGSNFMTRVCRTHAEIREQKEASEKLLGDERSRLKCSDKTGCM